MKRTPVLMVVATLALLAGVGFWARGQLSRTVEAQVRRVLAARFPGATLGGVGLSLRGDLMLRRLHFPSDTPGAPPVLAVEEVRLASNPLAWLQGDVALTGVTVHGLRLEAGPRGQGLLRWLSRAMGGSEDDAAGAPPSAERRLAEQFPAHLPVTLEDVWLAVGPQGSGGKGALVWGPLTGEAWVERPTETAGPKAGLSLFDSEGGKVELSAEAGAQPSLRVGVEGLAFPKLPVAGEALEVERGRLWLEARAVPEAGGARGSLNFRARTAEVYLQGERLGASAQSVGPFDVAVKGEVGWDLPGRTLELRAGRVELGLDGEVGLDVSAQAALRAGAPVRLSAQASRIDFDQALSRLPAAFHPGSRALNLNGGFGVTLELSGPFGRPLEWERKVKLELSGLRPARPSEPPSSLRDSFEHHPPEAPGRTVLVGPENPLFVPLDQLPNHLVRAVLLSEDSMFWAHQGFDVNALWRNLHALPEPGGVLRGGSTVTQQLAKNLFLSREKTYARKVREAFFTLALEAAVPKERLLEIYFNLIEWGPGLYGIGEAAQHYFGKDARALTLKESVFLASIIPSPTRYHGYCSRGAITPGWERQLEVLLRKMHAAGDTTSAELQTALAEVLRFQHH